MKLPLQVGITGGIGAGKSIVSRIFQCLGTPVYDADGKAKEIMKTDPVLIDQIKAEFGIQAYLSDGSLDRAFLAKATFGNRDRLNKLNSLVHPRVATDYQQWMQQQMHPYLLREAALLYEVGIYKTIDKMIVVTAPVESRVMRVLKRDVHRSEEDIHAIINSQWPEEEKLKRADYIVYNDEEHMLIPQVLRLDSELRAFAQHL